MASHVPDASKRGSVGRATKSSSGGFRGLKRGGGGADERKHRLAATTARSAREAASDRSHSPSSVEGPEEKRSRRLQQADADDAASVSETSDVAPTGRSSPRRCRWLLQSTSKPAAHQTRGARSSKESKPDFLEDFDPDSSSREMRKVHRRIAEDRSNSGKLQTLYDSHGHFLDDGSDLCDCLEEDCPGCFFPCPKCSSEKCGFACRCNRRWMVESIEIDGTGMVRNHPFKPVS